MRSPCIQPAARVAGIDAPANLQAAGISRERRAGFGLVTRTEHDDVSPSELVLLVAFGEPSGGAFRNKIRVHCRRVTPQRATDNLHHFAITQINARTKHGSKVEFPPQTSKFQKQGRWDLCSTYATCCENCRAVRACVIYNPAAKGQKAERFRQLLTAISTEAALKQTTGPRDARRLATQAIAEGFDTLIAAGGDGTLNEVLNGMGDAPDGFARARLGVLPLGTVNVFAREIKIPLKPEAAWPILRKGNERRIDLAVVENGEGEQRERTYFAQLAGAGLDSRAIELVDWPLKKKIGPLAYVVAGLQAMRETHKAITVSDGIRTVTGQLVLVGNGRLYGGTYRIFPEADYSDGKLDVCVFPRVNWPTLFRCGFSILLRGKLPEAKVRRLRAASFSCIATGAMRFEVDGELAGKLPARFSVQPQALRILIP